VSPPPHYFFLVRPLLSANQQCKGTEGTTITMHTLDDCSYKKRTNRNPLITAFCESGQTVTAKSASHSERKIISKCSGQHADGIIDNYKSVHAVSGFLTKLE